MLLMHQYTYVAAKLNQAYHILSYPAEKRHWTALNGRVLKYRVLQLKGITFIGGMYKK